MSAQDAVKMDVALSLSVLRLLIDARWGRPLAHNADGEEPIVWDRRSEDIASVLHDVANSDDPFLEIQARYPTHDQYRHLKTAIERYFEILAKGEYPQITGGRELKLGSVDDRVRPLKQILIILGDLDSGSLIDDIFDSNLTESVQRFQSRHGLEASGIVDRATLAELNISPQERLETLIINLERWRWIPDERETEKLVFVNVAGFELAALARHEIVLRSRVVVGKLYQATPLISSYIEKIEFNPYWNVPDSITKNEILPKLRKDPNYLTKEHMRILARDDNGSEVSVANLSQRKLSSIQIRQDPGLGNALGRVKIVFPNRHSVYLHDTPSRQFFARETRTFSHGCIRVADALALAAFLLDEPDDRWTVERAAEMVATNKTVVFRLRNPAKIAVSYRTAWVDLDGKLNFRRDIYGRDARMKRALPMTSMRSRTLR